jgi:hypothetical protein
MLEHIVVLKLKPGVTLEQTQALLNGLVALQVSGAIPGMLEVTGGYNNSPEGRNQGFSYGFIVRFRDAAARDAYLPHPEHKKLGAAFVRPIAEEVFVFDYEHR